MHDMKELAPERTQLALDALTTQIEAFFADAPEAELVAIADGAIPLVHYLAGRLSVPRRVGLLNASFHRDDVGIKPIPKAFQPTDLPFDVEGAQVLLIDDVFATGRTVRAALNELFDHGRPSLVRLGVLVDTGHRRFPFQPDFTGLSLPIGHSTRVNVRPAPTGAEVPLVIGLTSTSGPDTPSSSLPL